MPRQSYTIVHMLNSHEPGDLVPSPPPVKQEADLKKLMQNNNNNDNDNDVDKVDNHKDH